mgnify:CR=1 FL=1
MNTSIKIHLGGAINIANRRTGFLVRQEETGTKVYSLERGERRYLELPRNRYSLSSESPDCGYGYSQFENDFLSIIGIEFNTDVVCKNCGFDMGENYENCGSSEDGVCPECGQDEDDSEADCKLKREEYQ